LILALLFLLNPLAVLPPWLSGDFNVGVDAYCVNYLLIKKVRKGWIVINTKTGSHSHFKSKYGCYLIKKFIAKRIIPDNPYLQESYRRLTEKKKEYKPRYININKGIHK